MGWWHKKPVEDPHFCNRPNEVVGAGSIWVCDVCERAYVYLRHDLFNSAVWVSQDGWDANAANKWWYDQNKPTEFTSCQNVYIEGPYVQNESR